MIRKTIVIECPLCHKKRKIRKDCSSHPLCKSCSSIKKWSNKEYRKKCSLSHIGYKITDTQKKKISESLKGKVPKNILRGDMTRNKHWNWKGGITPEVKRQRNSINYKIWRKSCFLRDNFMCQISGQIGGELCVHHINNFSDFSELRFNLDNGITISRKIHQEFHKKYGIKNNTLDQLCEFEKEIKNS